MKYYLVALVDDKSVDDIISIQKFLNKKYKLYKNISNLYIPLGSVSNTELDKLDEIISKILSPYKKFKVGIDNDIFINDTSNTVNLKVKDKGYTIKPCVPKDWNEFEIKITNEKEDYTIKVKRFDKDNTLSETMVKGEKINEKQIQVLINGEIAKDNIIPRNKGKLEIVVYFQELRIEN